MDVVLQTQCQYAMAYTGNDDESEGWEEPLERIQGMLEELC